MTDTPTSSCGGPGIYWEDDYYTMPELDCVADRHAEFRAAHRAACDALDDTGERFPITAAEMQAAHARGLAGCTRPNLVVIRGGLADE